MKTHPKKKTPRHFPKRSCDRAPKAKRMKVGYHQVARPPLASAPLRNWHDLPRLTGWAWECLRRGELPSWFEMTAAMRRTAEALRLRGILVWLREDDGWGDFIARETADARAVDLRKVMVHDD